MFSKLVSILVSSTFLVGYFANPAVAQPQHSQVTMMTSTTTPMTVSSGAWTISTPQISVKSSGIVLGDVKTIRKSESQVSRNSARAEVTAAQEKEAAKKAKAKKKAAKKKAEAKKKAAKKTSQAKKAKTRGAKVVKIAKKYVGTPYRSGGSTPRGFDCSGFTSYVYKKAGVKKLPRSSRAQKHAGKVVSKPIPGDLIWTPGHVSIYVGKGKQIDAPRPGKTIKVRTIWQSNPTYIRVK